MHTKSQLPRLALVLLQANIIPEIQLQETLKHAQKNNQSLLMYVLQHFPVEPSIISQACARYFGLPHRELSGFSCEKLPLALINQKMIQLHAVLPIAQEHQQLLVAVCDPDDFSFLEDIQYQTGLPVQPVMAPFDQLTNLINRLLSTKNYTSVESLDTPAVAW